MNNLKEVYQSKAEFYEKEYTFLKNKKRIIGYLRLLSFLSFFIVIYYYSVIGTIGSTIISLILLVMFFMLIKLFNNLNHKLKKTSILKALNKDELNALHEVFDQFHSGTEYSNTNHEFSYDLDIFGEGSVFEYLNRTTTIAGKNRLAKELSELELNKEAIEMKQRSVLELAGQIDFRQEFSSTALLYDDSFREKASEVDDYIQDGLTEWSGNVLQFIKKKIWNLLLIILPPISFSLLTLGILHILPYAFMWMSIFINLSVTGVYLKRINSEHAKLGKRTKQLRKIKELIKLIEFSTFHSEYVLGLKGQLTHNFSAFKLIEKLYKTLNAFDMRLNMITGVLLNGFMLWDLQVLKILENQKKALNELLPNIFDSIGKFDALISLANYRYNNTDYVFPEISEKKFILKMKGGGHPLIIHKQRVTNDFSIDGLKKITIITGANMAGKSTFLRTVGVNMILACAGAPVCAEEMIFSPVPVYTSVRTNDSLHKSESYFFAELMRLKKITDILKSGHTLFVIIDEMLRGTNSTDKHKGSYELIKQLIRLNTSGLVATHDVQLGNLAAEYPEHVSNRRFEADIIDDELFFDYNLKDGISQNLNASFLMRKYGIIE